MGLDFKTRIGHLGGFPGEDDFGRLWDVVLVNDECRKSNDEGMPKLEGVHGREPLIEADGREFWIEVGQGVAFCWFRGCPAARVSTLIARTYQWNHPYDTS